MKDHKRDCDVQQTGTCTCTDLLVVKYQRLKMLFSLAVLCFALAAIFNIIFLMILWEW